MAYLKPAIVFVGILFATILVQVLVRYGPRQPRSVEDEQFHGPLPARQLSGWLTHPSVGSGNKRLKIDIRMITATTGRWRVGKEVEDIVVETKGKSVRLVGIDRRTIIKGRVKADATFKGVLVQDGKRGGRAEIRPTQNDDEPFSDIVRESLMVFGLMCILCYGFVAAKNRIEKNLIQNTVHKLQGTDPQIASFARAHSIKAAAKHFDLPREEVRKMMGDESGAHRQSVLMSGAVSACSFVTRAFIELRRRMSVMARTESVAAQAEMIEGNVEQNTVDASLSTEAHANAFATSSGARRRKSSAKSARKPNCKASASASASARAKDIGKAFEARASPVQKTNDEVSQESAQAARKANASIKEKAHHEPLHVGLTKDDTPDPEAKVQTDVSEACLDDTAEYETIFPAFPKPCVCDALSDTSDEGIQRRDSSSCSTRAETFSFPDNSTQSVDSDVGHGSDEDVSGAEYAGAWTRGEADEVLSPTGEDDSVAEHTGARTWPQPEQVFPHLADMIARPRQHVHFFDQKSMSVVPWTEVFDDAGIEQTDAPADSGASFTNGGVDEDAEVDEAVVPPEEYVCCVYDARTGTFIPWANLFGDDAGCPFRVPNAVVFDRAY